MGLIASNQLDFGQQFVADVAKHGCGPIVAPLIAFLERSDNGAQLRVQAKVRRPALKADIAHYMNVCFGRHPGIIDFAGQKIVEQEAREWLVKAIDAFALERVFLNRLTVEAGPIHRQIGQDRVNNLIESQGRSMEMLATSDRNGCPAGAAMAFALDWQNSRPLLDYVALRLGIEAPACLLPDRESTAMLATQLARSAAVQRAIAFGQNQMLAQQRGLWQVIAARHQALLSE
ncbi:MAG: hypothetical protein IPG54_01095 [Sphingomonadales bacterium]|jgi:hypothetical protein|nr:hypothetical protein [Sphingomonadales bacterium]MBK9003701.1 hypothetical protein [Sphingomonadales bacterium]MBK9268875.1 hypothetical protein [Sphingomonadales bacterium]MBP6434503.1 hypothetical protein [Sphingorhabdus sp.]